MKPDALPVRIDQMPREAREPSVGPILEPGEVIAIALSMIPYKWSGRALTDKSIPVTHVLDALKRGGWKIVPMEREDFE